MSFCHSKYNSILIVGTQFGDEGKGKIVDFLAQGANTIVRSQGGNNAGHTVVIKDKEYKLHLIPSGIFQENVNCYLGGGVVIDPEVLLNEIEMLEGKNIQVKNKLRISEYAHIIMPYHKLLDELMEKERGRKAIGTTKQGIGPCYTDKTHRKGIAFSDLINVNKNIFKDVLEDRLKEVNQRLKTFYHEKTLDFDEIYKKYVSFASLLKDFVKENIEEEINNDIINGKKVIFEGAQGTFLDNTFGTFPFVTSSSTLASGISLGAGVGPTKIGHVLGIVKAYTTRVGNGPLPTEILEKTEKKIDAKVSREFGVRTGRKRRIGWLDLVLLKKAIILNGVDSIALMKLDILDDFDKIKICTAYEINNKIYNVLPANTKLLEKAKPIYEEIDGWNESTSNVTSFDLLPKNAKVYIEKIRSICSVPISIISVGPSRDQTIVLNDKLKPQI